MEEGLGTGIAVSPVAYRSPVAFAMSAGTLSAISGGRFILGIGSGGIYRPAVRRALGFGGRSTIASMREYVTAVRALLAGETVDVRGEAVHLEGVQLGIDPPPERPSSSARWGRGCWRSRARLPTAPRSTGAAANASPGAASAWLRVLPAWVAIPVRCGSPSTSGSVLTTTSRWLAAPTCVRSWATPSAWRCQPKLSGVTAIVRISSGWLRAPAGRARPNA